LITNATDAESTKSGVTAFNTDGFELGSNASENADTKTYVAWNWKANGTGVSNTDGDITSTVSANVDAGFSIVKYPTSASEQTVGHGLSKAPELVFIKGRDGVFNWDIWFKDWTDYQAITFTTAEKYTNSSYRTITSTSATTMGVGMQFVGSHHGTEVIAYCFHSVDGYSKVGSYTGNGSTDGTFVYTGFRPAWMMMKRTDSTGHWYIVDNERDGYNASTSNDVLYANLSNAESDAGRFDFYSNGFKLRHADADINASGGTYIYIAFAEYPFKYTNAR